MAAMFSARLCRVLRATLAEVVAWCIVAVAAYGVLDSVVRWLSNP